METGRRRKPLEQLTSNLVTAKGRVNRARGKGIDLLKVPGVVDLMLRAVVRCHVPRNNRGLVRQTGRVDLACLFRRIRGGAI